MTCIICNALHISTYDILVTLHLFFCQGFKLRCTEYQVIEGGMKCWKISLECNYLFPDFWAACLLGERQERCNLLTRFLRNLIHAFLLFNIPKSAETKKEEGDKMISKRKRKRPSARTSRAEKCSNGTTPLRRASQILSHASPLNFWLVIPIWEILSFYQTTDQQVCDNFENYAMFHNLYFRWCF